MDGWMYRTSQTGLARSPGTLCHFLFAYASMANYGPSGKFFLSAQDMYQNDFETREGFYLLPSENKQILFCSFKHCWTKANFLFQLYSDFAVLQLPDW